MNRFCLAVCTLLVITLSACSDTEPIRSANQPAQSTDGSATSDVNSNSNAEKMIRPPWQMIGLKLDDAPVNEYLSKSSDKIDRVNVPGYGVFVSLYRDGIDLSADSTGTVTTVIIHRLPPDQYEKYSGPMPSSLKWDMTRVDVESAIGKPAYGRFTFNSITGRHEYFAEYPELGIYLSYDAKSQSDTQAQLIDIRIKNSEL